MNVKTVILAGLVLSSVSAAAVVEPEMEIPAPGEVKPTGWLLETERMLRDAYTVRMDEVDEQFRMAWAESTQPRGDQVHWWVEPGAWSAEGGAYWFDGLVRLAFQLDDPVLKAMASNRLETVLTRTNPESWGFCWWLRRDNPADAAALKGDSFLLHNSEKLGQAVCAWYEATGDERAARALRIAFSGPAFEITKPFTGAFDAWRLTRDPAIAALLDRNAGLLAEDNRKRQYCRPPREGLENTLHLRYPEEGVLGIPTRHGLNAALSLLAVLRAYQWTGDAGKLETVRAWYAFLDRNCRQPYGQTVMDEEWGWAGPDRASETCTAACENWTRIALLSALGEGTWGDDVEESVFNVAPNCLGDGFRTHTYMQKPNRLTASDLSGCSHGADPDLFPRDTFHGLYLEKHFPLCCTAALNRLWPDYVQAMWLRTRDGGVAAAMYGPCTFATRLSNGRFAVREETGYPYSDAIVLKVEDAPAAEMPLRVRLPRWCAAPAIRVNGTPVRWDAEKGFAKIVRGWKSGDVVALDFPRRVRYETMTDVNGCVKGEGPKDYGFLRYGPLLFAKNLDAADDNTPRERLARLPRLDAAAASKTEVLRDPLRLKLSDADGNPLVLVPYGTAKFRVSMFPVPETGAGVSDDEMKAVYEEVKTPYKVGIVLRPEEGEMLDNPCVFRHDGKWRMFYIRYDGTGYETCLAESDDLLRWTKRGPVLPRGEAGAWDAAQADGWPTLFDTRWGGSAEISRWSGRYWMMYLGGNRTGYETDPLSTGVAFASDPLGPWTRCRENPVLSPSDPDARPFERKTIYRHFTVVDPARAHGGRFVSFYNAKQEGVWRETIGMAVSDDLRHWRRLGKGPVISHGADDRFAISGDPMIQRIGDIWVMFHFGVGWGPGEKNAFDTFACSRDLVRWRPWTGAPLVTPSEPWDREHAHKPWVIRHDGVTYHFYCAVGEKGRALALAVSRLPAHSL